MDIIIKNPFPVRAKVGDDVMMDGRLTWAARGIFLHLAQLPSGTAFSNESLSRNTTTTPADVKSAMTMLKDTGYIGLEKVGDGRFIAHLKPVKVDRPAAPPKPLPGPLTHFDEFWALYPRKHDKAASKAVWGKKQLDGKFAEIIAGLRQQLANEDWTRDNCRFVAYPSTWLNRERWTDEDAGAPLIPSTPTNPNQFSWPGREYTKDREPVRAEFKTDDQFDTCLAAWRQWRKGLS